MCWRRVNFRLCRNGAHIISSATKAPPILAVMAIVLNASILIGLNIDISSSMKDTFIASWISFSAASLRVSYNAPYDAGACGKSIKLVKLPSSS